MGCQVIAQEIEAPPDPADKGFGGVLLDVEVVEYPVDNAHTFAQLPALVELVETSRRLFPSTSVRLSSRRSLRDREPLTI